MLYSIIFLMEEEKLDGKIQMESFELICQTITVHRQFLNQ